MVNTGDEGAFEDILFGDLNIHTQIFNEIVPE